MSGSPELLAADIKEKELRPGEEAPLDPASPAPPSPPPTFRQRLAIFLGALGKPSPR